MAIGHTEVHLLCQVRYMCFSFFKIYSALWFQIKLKYIHQCPVLHTQYFSTVFVSLFFLRILGIVSAESLTFFRKSQFLVTAALVYKSYVNIINRLGDTIAGNSVCLYNWFFYLPISICTLRILTRLIFVYQVPANTQSAIFPSRYVLAIFGLGQWLPTWRYRPPVGNFETQGDENNKEGERVRSGR